MSPLTSALKNWYMKVFPGMNNKREDLELQTKWVERAQNCRFEIMPGAIDKREPLMYFNTATTGAGAVMGLVRFYTTGGVTKFVKLHGTVCYVGNDTAGTWTSIRSGLTASKRPSFSVYKDLLMVSNGYDNAFVYDGAADNVTWELGACKAVLGTAGGNLDATADYEYKVTIDADAYVCDAVSNTITTATSKKVELSNIPLGPSGTTNRKIYRTEGDGSAFKLLATIADNTTTTYSDDVADGSLGAAYPAVTDDMPLGSMLKIHRERLFIAGEPNNPNRIYYSNPYLPHYIQQTTNLDYMDITPNDGDVIMGIPIQLGIMICIKKNTIRKLHITTPVSGASPSTWYADDPIAFIGSPAQWSIVQTPIGIAFLGWNHWYLFNGASAVPIIDEFDTNEILLAHYTDTVAYWHKGILKAAYTDVSGTLQFHDRVMHWNINRKTLSIDVSNVNCFAAKVGSDEIGTLYYGDSVNGFVYLATNEERVYRLRTKTEALLGTADNVFVGGTEALPYLEIGSTTSADEIPDDICIFWESDSTTPGTGWTEVDAGDKFLKISTAESPASTGTIGVSAGDDEAVISTRTFRIFKKNNTTTEYQFPDGAIVMWDQASPPVGFIAYPGYSGYLLRGDTATSLGYISTLPETGTGAGANLDSYVSIPLIKKIGEADTWDGLAKYIYVLYATTGAPGNGFSNITSTYAERFIRIADSGPTEVEGGAASTSLNVVRLDSSVQTDEYTCQHTLTETGAKTNMYDGDTDTYWGIRSYHGGDGSTYASITKTCTWGEERNISSIYVKMSSESRPHGNYDNDNAEEKIRHDVWVQQDGSWVSVYSYTETGDDPVYTVTTTDTYTEGVDWTGDITGVRVYAYGYAYSYEGNRSQDAYATVYEVNALQTREYYTMNLCKKILGQMQDYNAAIDSAQTNGVWESPAAEITAASLNLMSWNETISGTDTVELFTRTGATAAAVEDATDCTATNATNKFTTVGAHGLVNTDRVIIGGTATPTGISSTIMYFVVGVAGLDFQVSLTSGGAAVTFSDDGTAVTMKEWTGALTDPGGSTITSTAGVWMQYLAVFIAADSTDANPKVYRAGVYALKYTYEIGGNIADSAVEFEYHVGFRNFGAPDVDKIFKKLSSVHEGSQGSLTIKWETENSSGSFVIDLTTNPERWSSFFPSTAFGNQIDITFYKNDLYDLKIKEVHGVYTPEPMIL